LRKLLSWRSKFEEWAKSQLEQDLYFFGNHPELRWGQRLVFMRILKRTGIWPEAIRAAYDYRFNYMDFSLVRLTK
jgi:hypothetical protein